MSKTSILSNLKASLVANDHIPRPMPHYEATMKITHESILAEFLTNHSNNKGIIIQTSREKLADEINAILRNEGARRVLCARDLAVDISLLSGAVANGSSSEIIPYKKSVDETREDLFHIDTSIVEARCGVANVGVIGLSANECSPRLASLITNTCIYLLDSKNVVEHLFAGIELIKKYEAKLRDGVNSLQTQDFTVNKVASEINNANKELGAKMAITTCDANRDSSKSEGQESANTRYKSQNILPSNIIFVAGPSRTADIELQTVFGVHGPRKTYVLLY